MTKDFLIKSPLIIVATSGTMGDMIPFITLAKGLMERGHRVLLISPQFYESYIKTTGIDFKLFGTSEEFQSTLANPDLWDERKGWGVVWNGIRPYLGILREFIQSTDENCVVLCHPFFVPMADIARSVNPNLHVVCAYLAPSNLFSKCDLLTLGSLRIPKWFPTWLRHALFQMANKVFIDPISLPSLNEERLVNHQLPVKSFFTHIIESPDISVTMFPTWFSSRQPDWPQHLIEGNFPYNSTTTTSLPEELEQFLKNGDAPIVFTPGTGHKHAADYFAAALKVLIRLGRRGLFITPHIDQVPKNLPPQVLWLLKAPFNLLLPRAAALVHHGGIGTTAEAFRSGIPQLIVPFAFDQFDNGLRAKNLGVAEILLAKRMTADNLYKKLKQLLSSKEVASRCIKVAEFSKNGSNSSWLIDRIEVALRLK